VEVSSAETDESIAYSVSRHTSIQEPVHAQHRHFGTSIQARGHSSRTDRPAQLSMPAETDYASQRIRNRHKAIEEQLAKKVEELARSNGETEQFLPTVTSHDLQEPLAYGSQLTLNCSPKRYNG